MDVVKPQLQVTLVPESAALINDLPAHMYGGQLRPARVWILPDAQRVVFSMVDQEGRVYLANFDRDQLKAAINTGEKLFGN